MFITFNAGNYEEDSIGHKLRYVDAMSDDNNYHGTLERYTSHYDPNSSLYGRRIQTYIKSIKKNIQDIDKELREIKKRVDYYVDSGKMGGQRETELRNITQNYYKMKLDAFKTLAGFERDLDKSKKEDAKLWKELTAPGKDGTQPVLSLDDRSSDRNFLTNVLGGGVDQFFNNAQSNYYPQQVVPSYTQPLTTPVSQPVGEVKQPIPSNPVQEMKQQVVPETKPEAPIDFDKPIQQEVKPAPIDEKQITGYIKNANGVDVPIYEEGPQDFIEGAKTYTDAKLAYENISLSRNPNVQKMFKFNEDEEMGWLVYYDLAEKKEIKDQGSLRNIEQVFPFEVDKANNLVTTVLRENYPVIYTDEKPSEEVRSEYERLKNIQAMKENK